MRFVSMILGLAILAGCSSQKPLKKAEVITAYAMLAPSNQGDTLLYIRAIIPGIQNQAALCPELEDSEGKRSKMRIRGMHPGVNFPITVCEARVSEGQSYLVGGTQLKFEAMTLNPKRIQVYGDSGCKAHVCDGNGPAEPFKTLIDEGAKREVDLLLHMGDYNYRGTSGSISKGVYAYDAGDGGYGGKTCGLEETYYSQNATGSPKPDTWRAWRADFFSSADAILTKAPWVFARGNHELCSRAGLGWFYFFGPGSSVESGIAQRACPAQGSFSNPPTTAVSSIAMIDPYMLKLEKLNIWVQDTANACDDRFSNDLTAQYQAQYEGLQKFASKHPDKPIWTVTHRPLWGVNNVATDNTLNIMMQRALANTPLGRLPEQVALLLSGHMHIYQSLSFDKQYKRPPQIVVGNSGVTLSEELPYTNFEAVVDGLEANGNEQARFGFLELELDRYTGWYGRFFDEQGEAFLRCDSQFSARGEQVCQ
ncbi:metallophosphoesterase [Pseudoalteromonas luteoviolacea]|uniref:Metallophosphoesterase n=1 Tax=Pseudoalteromonas luteoviolacea TaxID=43657 RepID=A0A1C0TRB9_9GAMM|nr:metallophosphoesterase [Pseudoalteromonas luteoviolacea]OCQ21489.1 metallophosphoesterase [Pseudoalteromonas luteoviolacea]